MQTSRHTRYRIGRLPIDSIRRDRLVEAVVDAAQPGAASTFTYLNAHGFLTAWNDARHARLLNAFDVVFCDGVGLRLGLACLGVSLPERMTPPDFVDAILRHLADRGERVYLLGDEASVVAAAARAVEERVPGVLAGYRDGFFPDEAEEDLVADIRGSGARLVLVGMGSPRQEHWIERLSPRLGGGWLAVGGLFRWYSGVERRGPRWLTDHGFEWLCRLAVQRRRVARRYLLGLPRFALLIVRLRLFGPRVTASSTEP